VALAEAEWQGCDAVVVEDEVSELVQAADGVWKHGECVVGDVEHAQMQHVEHVAGDGAEGAGADVERQRGDGLFAQQQVAQQLVGCIGLDEGRREEGQGVAGDAQGLQRSQEEAEVGGQHVQAVVAQVDLEEQRQRAAAGGGAHELVGADVEVGEGGEAGEAVGEGVEVVALEQQRLQLVAGLVVLGEVYSRNLVTCNKFLGL
jgi:hypothetical protein